MTTTVRPPADPPIRGRQPASGHVEAAAPVGVFGRHVDHEQVVFCQDRVTGLRAIVAVHSTALGPALGGTRFYPYGSEDAALADVLNLSRGMTYKAALAGLDLGGGKAVIIGDPQTTKTPALLRAYGRFVQSLGGRYITACDVGTYVEDMDLVGTECDFVTGRSVERGGSGDSAVLTAYGVYQGMRAAAQQVWGVASLFGRTVGVTGVGKVGHHLVGHLLADGADVLVADVSQAAIARVRGDHPQITVVADAAAIVRAPIDVYSPCALGGALDDETVAALRAHVVCGAANNQLAHPGVESTLESRRILYAPDYVVNAGGLIQVADEIHGYDADRARRRAGGIFETTLRVFQAAAADGVPPAVAADRLAEDRVAEVEAGGIWLPGRGRAPAAGGAIHGRERVP